MNNEPVAWKYKIKKENTTGECICTDKYYLEKDGVYDIEPLYTTPKIKELSDEEILETVKDHFIGAMKLGIVLTNDNVLDFAKAILKKASEK